MSKQGSCIEVSFRVLVSDKVSAALMRRGECRPKGRLSDPKTATYTLRYLEKWYFKILYIACMFFPYFYSNRTIAPT